MHELCDIIPDQGHDYTMQEVCIVPTSQEGPHEGNNYNFLVDR